MKLKTELFPYQRAAVDKLIGIRVGALYMEMGTGKTRTALEIICRRMEAGKLDHVLWLCPCSVRQNLREDIQKHADGALAKIAIYGIESLSSSVRIYEALRRYVSAGTTMLIVDESNLVKNHKAIRTQRITALAKACRYRMIQNGTPVSRNEADLFAQWYLLDWRILGYRSFWSFAANHLEYDPDIPGRVRRTLNTDYLIEKIAPYAYQVSRAECFELPGKEYRRIVTCMTAEQSAFEIRSMVMDGVLWVFVKCGGQEWAEAPYNPHLSKSARLEPITDDATGYGLTLVTVDAADCTIRHLRMIGLGNRFSRQLYRDVKELAGKPFNAMDYDRAIAKAQMVYSTTKMVRICKNYWKL